MMLVLKHTDGETGPEGEIMIAAAIPVPGFAVSVVPVPGFVVPVISVPGFAVPVIPVPGSAVCSSRGNPSVPVHPHY